MSAPPSENPFRTVSVLLPTLLAAGLLAAGCGGEGGPSPAQALSDSARLAVVDSVLSDLGGPMTAALSREKRWRMISSVGTGLPPTDFRREDLPEPDSRAAALMEAYCTQCHGLPTPRMHAADEWPVLLRRMLARAVTLEHRMGGTTTEGLLSDLMMAGMARSAVPSPADQDTLLAYLQRNALPTASEEEMPEGELGQLVVRNCAICHEAPDPDAHTPAEWENEVVPRMQANMGRMALPPLTEQEQRRILGWLQEEAGG